MTFDANANIVTTYEIAWKGSPNFTAGREYGPPVAIIDHIMAGSIGSATSWFANSASQVSAHFGVAKDGRIYQYVKTSDSAWANGIVNKPNLAIGWIKDAIKKKLWLNALTVSIEHEGQPGDEMPEAQYQATLWLHRQLIAEFGIPADRDHICRHADIDSVSRANCPGPSFPLDRLISDLNGGSKPVTPTPTEPKSTPFNSNPNNFIIGQGMLDKLAALGLVASSNEQYFKAADGQPGLLSRSFVYTNVPGRCLIAFEQADGSWEVEQFQQL